MSRFLGNCLSLIYLGMMLLLLLVQSIGKTAPEISKIAFFKERVDGTGSDYWRLDVFTGLAFADSYAARIFIPEINQAPLEHFLAITGDANYYYISEVNLYTRESRYLSFYPSRGYFLLLAGNYIFTYDLASQWQRVDIATGHLDFFGRFLNLSNVRVSPDSQWITGRLYTQNWFFINTSDGSSYEIEPYASLIWSPNSRWVLLGDYQTAIVLNAADGSVLMDSFPARYATWSSDGESLVIENQSQLSIINIETTETVTYPAEYSFYWLQCLSPDKGHILSHNDTNVYWLDLTNNSRQALFPLANSTTIQCFWSADSRYLLFYLKSAAGEHFYFLDTQSHQLSETYPDNLPSQPIYLHIPE